MRSFYNFVEKMFEFLTLVSNADFANFLNPDSNSVDQGNNMIPLDDNVCGGDVQTATTVNLKSLIYYCHIAKTYMLTW